MPLTEFLKRLFGQLALASAVLYFALLALEKLIPGFVSPMVDLAQSGLAASLLAGAAVFVLPGTRSRWRCVLSAAAYFSLLAALLFFLSTRTDGLGIRGYVLLAVAAFLGGVGYFALWHDGLAERETAA